ncbi:MAG: hypothetical protein JNK82_28590 [Myxococcaceae bacterium]|nr:hypothetical protein [Myxococcaceae bacterium]
MSPTQRRWLLILGAVATGGLLTWLAFGYAVQEKPVPDLTNGVELVQPRDRSGR